MSLKTILVTGSSGLIGSEVSEYFLKKGVEVHGLDNNQRAVFFGPAGDTRWNQKRLIASYSKFNHVEADVRDRDSMHLVIKEIRPDAIIHAAAQPSHDLAARLPFEDFDTNAVGTMNLLEASRCFCPESPFVYLSTNKVYGDGPNRIPIRDLGSRYDYDDADFANGIPESFGIDQCLHSLFGCSKLAADIMVQEYGRYFGMPTCCLRGGCLTGPNHSGVELHGFLSYLVKCNVTGCQYRVYGYEGKQVRDNIHAHDVASFIHEFIRCPRNGEVYNIGGGKGNSCSILEAFELARDITGRDQVYIYISENRIGDHICYYSDLRKMQRHYPKWRITRNLRDIVSEMVRSWETRHENNRLG